MAWRIPNPLALDPEVREALLSLERYLSKAGGHSHGEYLTPDEVQAGSGVAVTENPDGTVTIAVNTPAIVRWRYGGTVVGVDPGAGYARVDGTGNQPRTFAISGVDADGNARNLSALLPGDNLTITDDPATPPITGFARYMLLTEPVNEGGWWSFTAERTDTSGTQTPPPVGTMLRFHTTLAAGGTPSPPFTWNDLLGV